MTRPCCCIWENLKFKGLPTFYLQCQAKSSCWPHVQFFCQSSSSVSLSTWKSDTWLQLKDQEMKVVMNHKVKAKSFSSTKRLEEHWFCCLSQNEKEPSWISSSSFFDFDRRLAAVTHRWCYIQKRSDSVWNAKNGDGCLFPAALRGNCPDLWLPSQRQTTVGVRTQNAGTVLGCADWQHVSRVNATIPRFSNTGLVLPSVDDGSIGPPLRSVASIQGLFFNL